ncbi:MAG: LLM class flavin-dependent oxidoreductase [Gammaproteobacteria bacterium]|nr:LLM class flavin-dependent oxidoreductase [Gammaproteobacteria bacterium]
MKFMFFFYPAVPGTLADRERLRPIAARTDRFQQMLDEVVQISQLCEEVGFSAVTFPEHHLHTEGSEMGSLPVLTQHVINNTKKIMAGPIGYVLPGWDPLRLALEIAWLDQITKGRTLVGFARGYQTRWLNQMAQHLHVSAVAVNESKSEVTSDQINREAFQEVYEILKLCWADKPFRYKGKYYEYPFPYDTGTPWLAKDWTSKYGSPGEIGENGNIQAIDVVPKPYTKPHPPLFQAFSQSEATIRWAAKEGLIPTLLTCNPDALRKFAEIHVEEAAKHGRQLALGEGIGVFRGVYMADTREQAREIAMRGLMGTGWPGWCHDFGFTEAARLPEDDIKYPGQLLPPSEITMERFEKARFCLTGNGDDVRREMDFLVETCNPEWFIWNSDQGYLPLDDMKRMVERFGNEVIRHYP